MLIETGLPENRWKGHLDDVGPKTPSSIFAVRISLPPPGNRQIRFVCAF